MRPEQQTQQTMGFSCWAHPSGSIVRPPINYSARRSALCNDWGKICGIFVNYPNKNQEIYLKAKMKILLQARLGTPRECFVLSIQLYPKKTTCIGRSSGDGRKAGTFRVVNEPWQQHRRKQQPSEIDIRLICNLNLLIFQVGSWFIFKYFSPFFSLWNLH